MKKVIPMLLVLSVLVVMGSLVFLVQGCGKKTITVQAGSQMLCPECGKVLASKITTKEVAKEEAAKYSVSKTEKTCQLCRQKQEQEAKRRIQEEKMARAREVFSNLEVDFGFSGNLSDSSLPSERSLSPGQPCWFMIRVKNHGEKPVSDLRFLVGPASMLQLDTSRISRDWLGYRNFNGQPNSVGLKVGFRELTKTGVLVNCGPPDYSTVINPSDSEYYPRPRNGDPGFGDAYHMEYTYSTGFCNEQNGACVLASNAPRGQDVVFTGYLIVEGQKFEVGTVTAHVMY